MKCFNHSRSAKGLVVLHSQSHFQAKSEAASAPEWALSSSGPVTAEIGKYFQGDPDLYLWQQEEPKRFHSGPRMKVRKLRQLNDALTRKRMCGDPTDARAWPPDTGHAEGVMSRPSGRRASLAWRGVLAGRMQRG